MPKRSKLDHIKFETAQEFGLNHRTNQEKAGQEYQRFIVNKKKYTIKKI